MSGWRIVPVCLAMMVWGCASKGWGPSEEWRLKNLEEHFLEFQDRQRQQEAETKTRLDELSRTVAALEQVQNGTAGAAAAPRAQDGKLRTASAASALDGTGASAGSAGEKNVRRAQGGDLYSKAAALAKAGKSAQARPLLNEFLTKYPKSSLAPNAIYWLGETYYQDGRFGQGILHFKEVTGRFPKDPKAAAALLKIGYCYERLGDLDNARFYLKTLLDEYPQSEPAAKGRAKLKSLDKRAAL